MPQLVLTNDPVTLHFQEVLPPVTHRRAPCILHKNCDLFAPSRTIIAHTYKCGPILSDDRLQLTTPMSVESLRISIGNVHCSDCEFTVRQTIAHFFTLVDLTSPDGPTEIEKLPANTVSYRLKDSQIDLYYYNRHGLDELRLQHSTKSIVNALRKNGFSILSWDFSRDGHTVKASEGTLTSTSDEAVTSVLPKLWKRYRDHQLRKHHLANCSSCHEKEQYSDGGKEDDLSDSSFEVVVDKPQQEFRAVFSVSGMSCAACVQSVSGAIQAVLDELNVTPSGEDPLFSVNLLQHSAIVLVPNKQLVNKIIQAVVDAGFTAQLLEVLSIQRSVNEKVTAVIGGITCAACVNSVVSAVNELPFILDSGVNAVTKSGQFVLENSGDGTGENIKKLKQTVEDCGFDFELVKQEKINYTSGKSASRSINISVDGMFCTNCPDLIMRYLKSFGDAIVIEDPISLNQPFVKFTYIPNVEKGVTVRRFLSDLNHLQPLENESGYITDTTRDGIFKCKLVERVSIDEHLRKLAKQETMKIVRRLVLATVIAIPSFVFGIVGMSLVSKHNSFRVWLEEPIWAGNVSRMMWIVFILSTPVYFFAADVFHVKAIKEIRSLWIHKNSFKKRFFKFGSMNLLMCLGTTISYVASIVLLILSTKQEAMTHMGFHTTYFDSVVFLTFFLLIGRLLESISKNKTADAVASLSSMKVTSATIVERVKNEKDSGYTYVNDQVVDVKLLDSGDYIRISTGESPAVDCVLVEGTTEFDESALTGESDPVGHEPGHQIYSGTVNIGSTSVIAKILSVDGDSLIDQIVSTVRDGQMRKAPIERLADVLTGYFVPVIVLLAILTWIIWLALAYSNSLPSRYLDIDVGGWTVWSLEFAIAVFVIACPCGIGLAAPTALFVGSGLAAKYGILAKGGGAAFQDAAKTNLVCFDKTGTLTYGQLKVTDFAFVTSEVSEDKKSAVKLFGLQLARDLELPSKHPIANAVKEFAQTHVFDDNSLVLGSNKVPSIETVPGKGLKGAINFGSEEGLWSQYGPNEALLGNESLLRDYDVLVSDEQKDVLVSWKKDRKSVVNIALRCQNLFGDDKFHLIVMLACRDEVRSESKPVIEYLNGKGIQCWMITGDNKLTADSIGKEIGIPPERIISEVLPDEKQAKVLELQKGPGNFVAMVGDGINDAPALASANVGIALSSGADLAVTSSDFILLNKQHPVATLCTLLDLSKVVFRRVRFNFGWSLIYNMIGIPIAAGVIYPYNNTRLSPVWASAAMAASSLSVVTSSLMLKFYRPKIRAKDMGVFVESTEVVTIHDL